jgi:hypothetical protein
MLRLWRFLVDKWWLVYGASVALFAAILAFLPPVPTAGDESVFYPLVLFSGSVSILILVIFAGYTLGCTLLGVKESSFGNPIKLFTATLGLSLLVMALIGPRGNVEQVDNNLEDFATLSHVDSANINDHVYNLAKHQLQTFVGHGYAFYECDRLGINCYVLYRWRPYGYPDFYADRDNPAFLSVDDGHLAVHIAGEVVYSHPL